MLCEQPERINQIEVSLQTQLYFDLLYSLLKLKLLLENIEYVFIDFAQTLAHTAALCLARVEKG